MNNFKYQTGMEVPQMPMDTAALSQMMSEQGAGQGVDFNGEPTPNISGQPSFADMYQEIKERYDTLILPLERQLMKLKKKLEENPTDETIKNEIRRIEEKIDRFEQQEDMEIQQLEAEVEKSGQMIDQQKEEMGMPPQDEEMPESMPFAEQQMPQEGMAMMQGGGYMPGVNGYYPGTVPMTMEQYKAQQEAIKREEARKLWEQRFQVQDHIPASDYLPKADKTRTSYGENAIREYEAKKEEKRAADEEQLRNRQAEISQWNGRSYEPTEAEKAAMTAQMLTNPNYTVGGQAPFSTNPVLNSLPADVTPQAYDFYRGRTKEELDAAQKDWNWMATMASLAAGGAAPSLFMPSTYTGAFGLGQKAGDISNRLLLAAFGADAAANELKAAANNDGLSGDEHFFNTMAMLSPIGVVGVKPKFNRNPNLKNSYRHRNAKKWISAEETAAAAEPAAGSANSTSAYHNKPLYDSLKSRKEGTGAINQETLTDSNGKKYAVNTITTADGKKYYISEDNAPKWMADDMNIINGKTGASRMAGEPAFSEPDEAIAGLNLIGRNDGSGWYKFFKFMSPHATATFTKGPAESYYKNKLPIASYITDVWKSKENIPLYDAKKKAHLMNMGPIRDFGVGTEWVPWRGGYTPWQKFWHKAHHVGGNALRIGSNLATDAAYLGRDLLPWATLAGGTEMLINLSRTGKPFRKKSEAEINKEDVKSNEYNDVNLTPFDSTTNMSRNKKALNILEGKKQGGGVFKKLNQFPITDFLSVGYDIGKLADNSGAMNIEAKRNLPLPSNNLWRSYDKAERDYRQQQQLDYYNYQLNNIKAMRQQPPVGEYGSLHMNNMARVLNARLQNEALLNNEKAYNAAMESTNKTLGSISQDALKNALERDSSLAIAGRDVLDQYYKDRNTLRNEKVSTSDSMMSRIMNIGNQMKQSDEIWERYYKILHDKNLTDAQKQMMINTLFFTNGRMPEEEKTV